MSSEEGVVEVIRIDRERVITLYFDHAPVIEMENFLPLIPDTVKVTLDEFNTVTTFVAKGVTANKEGARTKRQSTTFGYRKAYAEEVPDWLKREVRNAVNG